MHSEGYYNCFVCPIKSKRSVLPRVIFKLSWEFDAHLTRLHCLVQLPLSTSICILHVTQRSQNVKSGGRGRGGGYESGGLLPPLPLLTSVGNLTHTCDTDVTELDKWGRGRGGGSALSATKVGGCCPLCPSSPTPLILIRFPHMCRPCFLSS